MNAADGDGPQPYAGRSQPGLARSGTLAGTGVLLKVTFGARVRSSRATCRLR
jgi:hypothetical protein